MCEPGPIDIRFPLILLGKNAGHGIGGHPANPGRHHDPPPVQQMVEGEGAEGGEGLSHKLPQPPVRRSSGQMPQDLVGQFVSHHQGQFIVIEAEIHQPMGDDDLSGAGPGINSIALRVHLDSIFRRQQLGIKGRQHFLAVPLKEQLHRSGKIASPGFQVDMFQVQHDGGQQLSRQKLID